MKTNLTISRQNADVAIWKFPYILLLENLTNTFFL